MKLAGITCLGLLGATLAVHGQRGKDDTNAVDRACGIGDCFLENEVRDFQIVDKTHVIVYVGAQRCAFHIELRGAFCDLTLAPELYFRRLNEVPLLSPVDQIRPNVPGIDPFDSFEAERRERRDLRVCDNDLTVQVHGGVFTESGANNLPSDRFGNPRAQCSVSSVEAITDDQLLEFWVGRGVVAPPPPMGAGQIEVGEQETASSQPAATEGASTEPAVSPRRRRSSN